MKDKTELNMKVYKNKFRNVIDVLCACLKGNNSEFQYA